MQEGKTVSGFKRLFAYLVTEKLPRFACLLPVRLPRSSKYLDGQIISGDIPTASAISCSPRDHERESAFASVEDASPVLREAAASDVPFFLRPAIISAEC